MADTTTSTPRRRRRSGLGWTIVNRLILAALLVFVTYNPTGLSFTHLIGNQLGTSAIYENALLNSLGILVFGLLWWIFLRSAVKTLRGMAIAIIVILVLASYIAINWVNDAGFQVDDTALIWIAEVIISLMLGLGVVAGHLRKWWSGTIQTDDIGDNDD